MTYRNFKNIISPIMALILLIISAPIWLLAVIALKILQPKESVIFEQARPGLNGEIFNVLKFKTMLDAQDENGNLLPDNKRTTKIGNLLRKLSIDEIPQLINIVRGDMVFIGPRPLLVEYLPLYNSTHIKRHLIKPGITGWAQVNGRNTISWKEKFDLDIFYLENESFLLDFKILIMTIKNVFTSKDINQSEHITMEKFTGYQ